MAEAVLPRLLEDEGIAGVPFWTTLLLGWSTESPEELKSAVALLVQEVLPQSQAAILLARVHGVRELAA